VHGRIIPLLAQWNYDSSVTQLLSISRNTMNSSQNRDDVSFGIQFDFDKSISNAEDTYEYDKGELICASTPKYIPPWGMYFAAFAAAVFSIVIFIPSVQLLSSGRPDDFPLGVTGCIVGAIFLLASGCALESGKSGFRNMRLAFHANGVDAGHGAPMQFYPYDGLKEFAIEFRDPSEKTESRLVVGGVISLLAGNAAGVGLAAGRMKSRGVVRFQAPSGQEFASSAFNLLDLEDLGRRVSALRGEDVVTRIKY
jgi:hypothetical protein